jgi:hypothetical protein
MYLACNQIWQMKDSCTTGPLIIIDEPRLTNDMDCALIRGEHRPQKPVTYRYQLGGFPTDLLETTLPGRYLLSDRIVDALNAAKFSGWLTYPVKITGKDGEDVRGYHGLSVTGRCNPVDWPEKLNPLKLPPYWDGSDIFLILNRKMIGVTEQVYEMLKGLRPSNMTFVRKDESIKKLRPEIELPELRNDGVLGP